MHNDCFKRECLHSVGRVDVIVRYISDYGGDSSWLGEYTDSVSIRSGQWLYHRSTGLITNDGTIWRNAKGHIQTAPFNRSSREYQYIRLDNGQDCIKHALQDAKRLEALNDGEWQFVGIEASVMYDGVEIASDSCFGFESDAGDKYLHWEARDIARAALAGAREWLNKNCRGN
jgi:hypothetical protein